MKTKSTLAQIAFTLTLLTILVMVALPQSSNRKVGAAPPAQSEDCSIDLMLVLDSSGSIVYSDFEVMKAFVRDFVGSFTLGPNGANIGIVQFSDTVRLESGLSDDLNTLNAVINNMVKLDQYTNITSGIDLARRQLSAGRADVPKVIIVLTDGLHNTGPGPIPLSDSIRNSGTTILGVAVGDIDLAEITAIAGGTENVIPVPDFDGLRLILNILYDYSCAIVRNESSSGISTTTGGTAPQVATVAPQTNSGTTTSPTVTVIAQNNPPAVATVTPTPLVVAYSPLAATTSITFASDRDGDSEIYVMGGDGSGLRQLTFNNANDDAPTWSPDGTQIAFESDGDGDSEIYVMNADGSNIRKITNNDIGDWGPAWSFDGGQIAFHTEIGGDLEVYTINLDGSGLRQITDNRTNDRSPAWSPDGTKLVFFHIDEESRRELHIVDLTTLVVTPITDNQFYDGLPDWTNDGRIVFGSARADGNSEIYMMAADGSNVVRLTNHAGIDDDPAWTPNGQQVVFESDYGGTFDIWVMNADGTGLTQLTNHPARDWSPDVTQAP